MSRTAAIKPKQPDLKASLEIINLYSKYATFANEVAGTAGPISFYGKILSQIASLIRAKYCFLLKPCFSKIDSTKPAFTYYFTKTKRFKPRYEEGQTSFIPNMKEDSLAASVLSKMIDGPWSVNVINLRGGDRFNNIRPKKSSDHWIETNNPKFKGHNLSEDEIKLLDYWDANTYTLIPICPGNNSNHNKDLPIAVIGCVGNLDGEDKRYNQLILKTYARLLFPLFYWRVCLDTMVNFTSSFLDYYDPYTCHHSKKVTIYALEAAKALKLPIEILDIIGTSSPFHDIGKMFTHRSILWRPYKLNKSEKMVIDLHPEDALILLRQMSFMFSEDELAPVLFHHRQVNGAGYPSSFNKNNSMLNRLDKAEIEKIKATWGAAKFKSISDIATGLVQLADCFDAATSFRPYSRHRKQKTLSEFEKEIIEDNGILCKDAEAKIHSDLLTNEKVCNGCQSFDKRKKNGCKKKYNHFVTSNFVKFKESWHTLLINFQTDDLELWDKS